MKHVHCHHVVVVLGLLTAAVFLPGCAAYRPLRIEPIASKSGVVQPDFQISHYQVDRDQNLHFVMTKHTTDRATGQPVDQIAIIRVFWQPVGGRTSLDPSSINATFRYVVMTATAVGSYEGAGFVRLYATPGDSSLLARIVDGDLRLTEASKDFHDDLGRAQLSGNFSATLDDDTMDLILSARRRFFQRSLDLAQGRGLRPGTQPATASQPATSPAATR